MVSCETVSRENPVQAIPDCNSTSPAVAIEQVVDAVKRDRQVDAGTYLEESTVPHGGE